MPLGYMPEDEDELLDSGSDPYSSLSSRPLDDSSLAGDTGAAIPNVKNYIASRKGMAPAPSTPDYSNDPMMQSFDAKQNELDKFRNNLQENQTNKTKQIALGQIAQQLARGAQAPDGGEDVSKTLAGLSAQQTSTELKGKEEDLERRQKILNAIEQRASREGVAAENRSMREAALKQGQMQKDSTRGIQVNRLLGQTEKELRDDPLAKPAEMNLASLGKSKMTLENPNVPLTPQMLSDAEQDIASALSLRGQGATEGKIQRTELLTMGRKLAELKQKWGNQVVDLRKEQPELVNQIKGMNQALMDDYKTTIAERKHGILDDREAIWGDDPAFANKLQALRGSITKKWGPAPTEQAVAQASPSSSRMMPPGSPGVPSGGFMNSANAGGGGPKVVRKQFSPSRNQTKLTYDDGSEAVIDGKQ